MQKKMKKLALSKETIRRVTVQELAEVMGGMPQEGDTVYDCTVTYHRTCV